MEGTLLVAITLFGWPFVLASLYLMLPAQRAAIVAFLFAWLFLPVAEYEFQGIPEYNKMTATCLGAFLATLMFDPTRLVSYRPRWVDLSCLILCFCPVASSLTNGLGLYDGLSESLRVIIQWGFPYFLGRIYFNDLRGMRELAIGVFIAGIIYVPLCWIERLPSAWLCTNDSIRRLPAHGVSRARAYGRHVDDDRVAGGGRVVGDGQPAVISRRAH
ncbi:MAG: hypothetical protein KJ060_14790 [Candidatus Hydrogenedentes bacterium]|nr:hypothetical protein [Candidatus Hydrogenedentota bacterium]